MRSIHVVYKGRVQGVGFRFTVGRIAKRFDMTGFVKNVPDGTVEVRAEGPTDQVESFIADVNESMEGYIRQSVVEEESYTGKFPDFRIEM
ncbi:MAG: acylphosphatase [Candidatus Aadella gelida]|nr:acylphosphatase [Candidatus Aadella gelida]